METSVCKEWASTDAFSGSAVNQSHRDVTPSLEPNSGNARANAHSETRRSRDPRLAARLHTRPIQAATSMIQPAVSANRRVTIYKIAIDPRTGHPIILPHSDELTCHDPATQPNPAMISIPSGVPIHTFRVTGSVILSHTIDEVTGHAANSVVDTSNSTQGQPSGSDVEFREAHDDNQTMVRTLFKTALKEFVIKHIEKTRRQGQPEKELRDFIVQKTVDKIMLSEKNFPSGKEMIGKYLSLCKGKIKRLIQEYFHKYEAKFLQ